MRFAENTIKDLGTLNRGQSMLLNLYLKGYTHINFDVYTADIDLIVYDDSLEDLSIAEMIIRNQMADGDTIEHEELENKSGTFNFIRWRGHLNETEYE